MTIQKCGSAIVTALGVSAHRNALVIIPDYPNRNETFFEYGTVSSPLLVKKNSVLIHAEMR